MGKVWWDNTNLLSLLSRIPLLDISLVTRIQELESQAKMDQLLHMCLSSGKELELTIFVLSGNETKALTDHLLDESVDTSLQFSRISTCQKCWEENVCQEPAQCLFCSVCCLPVLWFASRIFSVECMGQLLTHHLWWLDPRHGLSKDHPSEVSELFPTDPHAYHDNRCVSHWTTNMNFCFFASPSLFYYFSFPCHLLLTLRLFLEL